MPYLKPYQFILTQLRKKKKELVKNISNKILNHKEPIIVGNMVYWVAPIKVNETTTEYVAAYQYLSDWQKNNKEISSGFYPIYDENETMEFGWTDFEECCRIFEVIEKNL